MTEQECRNFVLSGFVPTSNEDIADIQDCFNHQSVDFQIGLLMNVETRANAERLMRACLHSADEVDALITQANDINQILVKRDQYVGHIEYLEGQIKNLTNYLKETEVVERRWREYVK